MLQRIQTVFLILATLLGIAVFLFPLTSFTIKDCTFDLFITGCKNIDAACPYVFQIKTYFHMIILIAVILLCIGTIFLYKKRTLQMRLCRFVIMADVVFIFLIFMFADTIKNRFIKDYGILPDDIIIDFKFGSIIPIIMIVFLFLANRYIKKDENLIKSADRLR